MASNEQALPWTVRRLLEWTTGFFTRKQVDSPRLSAELLLGHVLNLPRIGLYTNYERLLGEDQLTDFRALVKRAGEHEPIAYLTGRAFFFNLELRVTRDVLIPRPDTETVVENVLQWVRNTPGFEAARVLDVCTGSGCVALAIAERLKSATLTATDISPAALAVARHNAERLGLGGRVVFALGDLFEPLRTLPDAQPFNIITANPPYIASSHIAQLDRNVRDYEPHLALDGGPDGLDVVRRILTEAPDRLTPGGRLFIEIAFDQGAPAKTLGEANPAYDDVRILKDYAGNDRVLTVRKKS